MLYTERGVSEESKHRKTRNEKADLYDKKELENSLISARNDGVVEGENSLKQRLIDELRTQAYVNSIKEKAKNSVSAFFNEAPQPTQREMAIQRLGEAQRRELEEYNSQQAFNEALQNNEVR